MQDHDEIMIKLSFYFNLNDMAKCYDDTLRGTLSRRRDRGRKIPCNR